MKTHRFIHLLLLLGILSALSSVPAQAKDPTASSEDQVKAAFLMRFIQFVTWPTEQLSGGTCIVGVVGDSPMGQAVAGLSGQMIGDLILEVRAEGSAEELAKQCHVLLICGTIDGVIRTNHPLWKNLGWLGDKPLLTVGEDDDFLAAGGSIGFFLQDDRVRFAISRKAADRAGVRISSKLMRLATVVD